MRLVASLLLALALVPAPPAAAERAESPAKARRQELDVLTKETFRRTVLVRSDLQSSRPTRERLTELHDGSYYEHADPSIAFEELSPATITRLSLRRDGTLLLVTLAPPSNIVPAQYREASSPEIGVPLLVEVEVPEGGSVREALRSIVYLPDESPDGDAVARCVARYPEMDEKRSAMRCMVGQPRR